MQTVCAAGEAINEARQRRRGAARVLAKEFHVRGVQHVSCPPGQPIAKGNTFTCRVRIGGTAKHVTVRITNATDGEYRVSAPR
jgi:hypothetical protein